MKVFTKIFIAFVFLVFSSESVLSANIKLGVDVMIESGFNYLKGKKICLLTNQSGRTSDGKLTADVFIEQDVFTLVGIFAPEHGMYGSVSAGAKVSDETYKGVPVYSLYGQTKKPENSVMNKCDAIVIDIQDIGIRSYTFISSMFNVLKACAEIKKQVFILDRPNPLGGLVCDGPTVDPGHESFIGIAPIAYIHGCTIGELAKLFNEEGYLGKDKKGQPLKAKLTVIKMKNWTRDKVWEDTGLYWFPTSPHIPTPDAIRGSAMFGAIGELGFLGIGIGTTLPFQYIGAPGFKCDEMDEDIKALGFKGVNHYYARFKPFYGKNTGEYCDGFLFRFNNNPGFTPFTSGINIILILRKYYPDLFGVNKIDKKGKDMFIKACGGPDLFKALFECGSDEEAQDAVKKGREQFMNIRAKYLIYE